MSLPDSVIPLDRSAMAARVARDIPEGWYVNLGIGIPTLVADAVPDGREVLFHSENGILGIGPAAAKNAVDPWLVNAGKQHITLVRGGSFFDHASSFGMIRGGHIDLCVLGAYEVSASGDLANWATSANDTAPAVGGAMDLAAGSKRVWVVMEHTTKSGDPRVVDECSYPLTAPRAVSRIYTNLAVLEVTGEGLRVIEMIDGLSRADLEDRTATRLIWD